MSEIIFNDQQEAAIHKVLDWYGKHQRIATQKEWFFLSGYAGTGKTTLAKYIVGRKLAANCHVVIFTNRQTLALTNEH